MAPHLPVQAIADPAAAVAEASAQGGRVVVAGSLFLVGAVRAVLADDAGTTDPA
jgi:hypothetical protein